MPRDAPAAAFGPSAAYAFPPKEAPPAVCDGRAGLPAQASAPRPGLPAPGGQWHIWAGAGTFTAAVPHGHCTRFPILPARPAAAGHPAMVFTGSVYHTRGGGASFLKKDRNLPCPRRPGAGLGALGQPSSSFTKSASSAAMRRMTDSSRPSTMTRIRGSVPLTRTNTRPPSPRSSFFSRMAALMASLL